MAIEPFMTVIRLEQQRKFAKGTKECMYITSGL